MATVRTFNPDDLSDEMFQRWWPISPTQAQVEAQLALEQKSEDATRLKARRERWRAANPDATCSDAIADLLAEMEEAFGGR